MKKVQLPSNNEEPRECLVCQQLYCECCIKFVELDFKVNNELVDEGDQVCPWCYNQLIDKFEAKNNGT